MKRALGVVVVLAVLVAALSSHSKSSTSTTSASNALESTPALTTPSPPAAHSAHASYRRCDQNIRAGAHTTCDFAENVFRAFARDVSDQGSEPANYSVHAGSPATGKTYSMDCRTSGGSTLCAGGTDARVRFPLSAAEVYEKESPPPTKSTQQYETPPSGGEESESTEREASPAEPEPNSECTNGTYENSKGNTVCKPEESLTQPAGATARCQDGTYSFSESRSGTCSDHGGVAEWLE